MPILSPASLEIISRSPEQTRRVGIRLGSLLVSGDVVCLVGELGSGKTTLVQGIAAGWGSTDTALSPTFVLVNVYRQPEGGRLFHLDSYRISGPAEAEDLDLISFMDNGPLVVEWAERIQEALPKENLWVNLTWIDELQRDLVLTAHGTRYQSMITVLRKQIYGG